MKREVRPSRKEEDIPRARRRIGVEVEWAGRFCISTPILLRFLEKVNKNYE